jgi:hypothetical protein
LSEYIVVKSCVEMGVDVQWEEQYSQKCEGDEEANVVEHDPRTFSALTEDLLHVEEEV